MRRLLLASVAVFVATVLAVSVSLFAFPKISLAGDPPSQGTFTQGASAGPNEPSLVRDTAPSASVRDDAVLKAGARGRVGGTAVRVARWHLGTPYGPSPPGLCKAYKREDCSCLTKLVFARLGKRLPESPVNQWKYGRKVAKRDLRPGDLVFFKEAGMNRSITHVGIYSGKGRLVHASNYFNKVVESKMSYMRGYYGARRITRLD